MDTSDDLSPVLPGSTIGILGGGQLGRMSALAARAMGYRVHILDPDPQCCAAPVADKVVAAAFDDPDAARQFAKDVAVVTFEIEKIGPEVAGALQDVVPLRPRFEVLRVVQDKGVQKDYLQGAGLPVGPYAIAHSKAELVSARATLAGTVRTKVCRGGYDGRGQVVVPQSQGDEALAAVWDTCGAQPLLVEQELPLALEFSLCIARRPEGDTAIFPPAQNIHFDGQLKTSLIPAALPKSVVKDAAQIAREVALKLDLVGLLTVEFFVTPSQKLFVNELAPRPHNTFHGLDMACSTSQFEQHIRAVCNLPLGSTRQVRATALHNILGDTFLGRQSPPDFARSLAEPEVRLFLYGKAPKPKRKVGHLLATADTPAAALARVEKAFSLL